MAGIDKTYTKSWKEYQEVVNWAENTTFTCPNGTILHPIDYVYKLKKEYFQGDEHPIMNTSCTLDYFLIKYCPIKLVQDRMREVYEDEYIESILNGTSEYDTFIRPESGTKVKMIRDSIYHNRKPFSVYNRYTNKKICYVSIKVYYNESILWYNEKYDKFIFENELGEWNSSNADIKCKSLKAIVRRIKKWKLPKDAIVTVKGRYVGETWKFKIK